MRLVIQRVKQASVTVDGNCIGAIGKGLLIFVGIGLDDDEQVVEKYADKVIKMRIFDDNDGKTNLSLSDVQGEILAISQFTLYADCKKGNRPNFLQAAAPDKANALYQYFLEICKQRTGSAECGEFGADMKVDLINDGPFTIVLNEGSF